MVIGYRLLVIDHLLVITPAVERPGTRPITPAMERPGTALPINEARGFCW